jgi:hypothetical protein
MAKRKRQPNRRIRICSIRHDPPDLHKLSRALIALALEQSAAEEETRRRGSIRQRSEDAA